MLQASRQADVVRMGSLVLSTRNELLLYHLNPTSDAPLVLKHSSPVQEPCRSLSWRNDGQKFLAVAENTLTVWSKDGACLWELDRVRFGPRAASNALVE